MRKPLTNVLRFLAVYLACCAATELLASEEVTFDDGWKMTITAAPEPKEPPAPGGEGEDAVDVSDYERIYNAIPFRRAVFNANPQYRHDATMEILFGELRDTVIHRYDRAPVSRPYSRVLPSRPGEHRGPRSFIPYPYIPALPYYNSRVYSFGRPW